MRSVWPIIEELLRLSEGDVINFPERPRGSGQDAPGGGKVLSFKKKNDPKHQRLDPEYYGIKDSPRSRNGLRKFWGFFDDTPDGLNRGEEFLLADDQFGDGSLRKAIEKDDGEGIESELRSSAADTEA